MLQLHVTCVKCPAFICLKLILITVFRSMESTLKSPQPLLHSFLPFSKYEEMHLGLFFVFMHHLEFSACFATLCFSHLFQETCMWFDLSAPYSQFFTDSTSSVVIVTASYLCVVSFVKASTSAALQAALGALCVPFLRYFRAMFLTHFPSKDVWKCHCYDICVPSWETPSHDQNVCYIFLKKKKNTFSRLKCMHSNYTKNLFLFLKVTREFKDSFPILCKEALCTSTFIIHLWKKKKSCCTEKEMSSQSEYRHHPDQCLFHHLT